MIVNSVNNYKAATKKASTSSSNYNDELNGECLPLRKWTLSLMDLYVNSLPRQMILGIVTYYRNHIFNIVPSFLFLD